MKSLSQFLKKNSEGILVLCISLFTTFITTIQLFAQLLQKPSNSIFVGLTHYWEDFFFYLDHFFQGAHGQWFATNNFSIEPQTPSLVYFFNLLLGKLGGFFGLEPFITYHISTLILKFIFFILSYYVISLFTKQRMARLIIFLIFLYSTTLPLLVANTEGSVTIQSARIFRSENTISARFGNVPEGLIRNILFLFVFTLLYKLSKYIHTILQHTEKISYGTILKNASLRLLIPLTIVVSLMTLLDVTKTIIGVSAIVVLTALSLPKQNKSQYILIWIFCLTFILIPSFGLLIYLNTVIGNDPLYMNAIQWDISEHINQIAYLTQNRVYALFSLGTLGIFFLIGLIPFIKRNKTHIEKYMFIIVCISIIGFFSPIHRILPIPGFRFIFSSTYIFFAIIAFAGMTAINRLCGGKILYGILMLYFIPNIITYSNTLMNMIQPLKEPYHHFAYIPNNLYSGLIFLRHAQPKDAIVLAGPGTSMDILLPGLTGKKTFTGHLLMTPNNKEKDKVALEFLYKWTDQGVAKNFLQKNNIRYVMWTKYGGDVNQIKRDYPFLQTVFENDMITIFTYQ